VERGTDDAKERTEDGGKETTQSLPASRSQEEETTLTAATIAQVWPSLAVFVQRL
jgi:hypothetical protein